MKPFSTNSYSAEERTFVRRHYPHMTNEEIGKQIGRSPDGVRKLANKLQVEKSPEFTAQQRRLRGQHISDRLRGRSLQQTSPITVESLGRLDRWSGVVSVFSLASKFQE